MTRLIRLIAPSLVLVVLAATGCGGNARAICEKQQECGGGNDADLDACVAALDGDQAVAAAYDCSDQYNKVAECLEAKGTCKGSGDNKFFTADCGDESESLSACERAATDNK